MNISAYLYAVCLTLPLSATLSLPYIGLFFLSVLSTQAQAYLQGFLYSYTEHMWSTLSLSVGFITQVDLTSLGISVKDFSSTPIF